MSKYTFLLLAGLFIGVLPYLGFPSLWDTTLFTLGGLFVVIVSVLARVEYKRNRKDIVVEKQPAYVESKQPAPRRSRQMRPKTPKGEAQDIDIVVSRSSSVHTEAE